MNTPIYYVIATSVYQPAIPYQIWTLRKVVECDVDEISDVYNKEVAPLYDQGQPVTTMIYAREPTNPFKTFNDPLTT